MKTLATIVVACVRNSKYDNPKLSISHFGNHNDLGTNFKQHPSRGNDESVGLLNHLRWIISQHMNGAQGHN